MDNHIDNAKLILKKNGKSFYWAGKFLSKIMKALGCCCKDSIK